MNQFKSMNGRHQVNESVETGLGMIAENLEVIRGVVIDLSSAWAEAAAATWINYDQLTDWSINYLNSICG